MPLPPIINRIASRLRLRGGGNPTEGGWRPPPYYLPIEGGWLPTDAWNWWQLGGLPIPQTAHSAIVEACISAYSQTVAMCPGARWRKTAKGGRELVTNSALSRVLKRPNDYQIMSDFMLNMVRLMYLQGNAYAVAIEPRAHLGRSFCLAKASRSA
jgi:phage portal protein BeeE